LGSARTDLILYYAGLGFALFLVWGLIAYDVNKNDLPGYVKPATNVLYVVGLAHPVAMVAAWDMRRQLSRTGHEAPARPTVTGLLPTVVSLGIAAVAIVLLGS
jgi:hypothetical protein